MENRYSTGDGRGGEREEQLVVRRRLVATVAAAIASARVKLGLPWHRLPFSLESWRILVGEAPSALR